MITLVEGERENIKITTPEDLVIAEALLHHRTKP
jgi:2-C-methyl-D-erythritol 4-phosphate cytidylyltransferase